MLVLIDGRPAHEHLIVVRDDAVVSSLGQRQPSNSSSFTMWPEDRMQEDGVFTIEFFLRLIGWSVVAGLSLAAASRLSQRVIGEPFSPKEGSGVTGVLMFFLAGFQMARHNVQAAVIITVVVVGTFVVKWLEHRERQSSREDRS